MVVLDVGVNEVAERFAADITKGQWGSSTTLPTVSDTGLNTAIVATLLTLDSAIASGNSSQFQHTVPSTTANGNTFAEFELQFDDGTSFNHSVGASFSKTSSFDVTTLATVNFVRQ
jgi:hypothetical protein